jgi:hypothetical protein
MLVLNTYGKEDLFPKTLDKGLLEYLTSPGWHVVTLLLMCASVGSEDLINSPTKNCLLHKIDSVLTGNEDGQ